MSFKAALVLAAIVATSTARTTDDCDRNCDCRQDSDGFYRVDCSNRHLNSIPETFPARTRTLDLSNNKIEKISALPDLDQLTLLNFTNNEIRAIHYDAFDGLDSLTTLVLSHNYLSSIDDDIFEWNPLKLKHIYLDHNRFEYVQHMLFYDLTDLEEIDLSNNILFKVHSHAFNELENLRKLDLSHNHLPEFEPKWVKALLDRSLIEVKLDHNKFACDCTIKEALEGHGFFKDDQLQSLLKSALYRGRSNLTCADSGKDMWSVSPDHLAECSKPVISGISKSSEVAAGKSLLLKCVAEGTPTPTIEWRAPNEDIYRLTSDDFEGVTVHQDGSILIEDIRKSDAGDYFCVAKNSKGSVEAKTTITVTGDDIGDLDRDEIDEFDDDTPLISDDDLGWHYDVVDKDWGMTQDGDFNKELDDDYDIDPISDIQDIDMGNEYEYREKDCPKACDCNSDMVDCSDSADMEGGTPYTFIPDRLPPHTLHLDMNVNEISTIENDICKRYPNLQELKVDDNKVSTIEPEAFKYCQKLRILTLRNNQLDKITPGMFTSLTKVQILVLDNNFLEKIPDHAFAGMDDLEYLYIRENRINKIESRAFHGLPKIRFIHLEDNKIETIEREWIEEAANNENLKRIFLEDNNLNCDSKMKEFESDFTREETRIYKLIQPADLSCSYPKEQFGKFLNELDFKVLIVEPGFRTVQDPTGGNAGLMVAGIFVGIVLTALIFVVWRKWNRSQNFRRGGQGLLGYSHLDINDQDNESRALTADQEAFI